MPMDMRYLAGLLSGQPRQPGGILAGQPGMVNNVATSNFQQMLDPQVALPVAAALIGGRTLKDSLAGGFAAAAPGMAAGKKRKAFNAWLKAGSPKDPSDPATQALFAEAPEIAEKYIGSQFGTTGGKGFGDTPLYFKDKKDGTLHVGRFNDDGGVTMATPDEGMEVADPMTYLNTGGNFTPAGRRTGVEGAAAAGAAPVPIDNISPARDAKVGAGQGEAAVSLASMRSKLPGVEAVVKQLDGLADKATYTGAGQIIDTARRQFDWEPRESAVARAEYISMVDNQVLPLLRDTFGAAFTEKEGNTLRATLGDPDISPKEKKAKLRAFIEQKRRDLEAQAVQAGQTGAFGPAVDLGNGVTIERIE